MDDGAEFQEVSNVTLNVVEDISWKIPCALFRQDLTLLKTESYFIALRKKWPKIGKYILKLVNFQNIPFQGYTSKRKSGRGGSKKKSLKIT